jgi:CubicO group peptidase (beta-lactamase class C family)
MFNRRQTLAGAAAVLAPNAAFAAEIWPGPAGWETQAARAAGLDPAALEAALDLAMADRSTAALVVRGGRIVAERYAAGRGARDAQEVASVGKSMLAMLTGTAIDRGMLKGLDQPAADFIPAWRDGPKSAITIRHILSMTSGLDIRGLRDRGVVGDQFAINSAVPVRDPPGTRWVYATPIYHLLFHILARASGQPFEAFADAALIRPLGLTDTSWVTAEGQGAAGATKSYYTARCSARDLARFGLCAMRGGRWGDRRIVGAEFMAASVAPSQDLNPAYGLLWWNNRRPGVMAGQTDRPPSLRFPGAPADAFAALGAGSQVVLAVPSRDLVIVRQGTQPERPETIDRLIGGVIAATEPRD